MSKILLVEDNEMNRDMLSRRLVRSGFEVVIGIETHAQLSTRSKIFSGAVRPARSR